MSAEPIQFLTYAGGSLYLAAVRRLEESLDRFARFPHFLTVLKKSPDPIGTDHKPAILLAAPLLKAAYAYWIDADMELTADVSAEDILPGGNHDLAAVRHFYFKTQTAAGLSGSGPYWQACLMGGKSGFFRDVVSDAFSRICSGPRLPGAADEPYFNAALAARAEQVRTLPVTLAAPLNFPWGPAFEGAYKEAACGRAFQIVHYNLHNEANKSDFLRRVAV